MWPRVPCGEVARVAWIHGVHETGRAYVSPGISTRQRSRQGARVEVRDHLREALLLLDEREVRALLEDQRLPTRALLRDPLAQLDRIERIVPPVNREHGELEAREQVAEVELRLLAHDLHDHVERRLAREREDRLDELRIGPVERVDRERVLPGGPFALDLGEVPLERLLGHRPRERVIGRAHEPDRTVDQGKPADSAPAVLQVLERDRASHGPPHESRVLDPELRDHVAEVCGQLVEVVATIGLVGLAHAAQVERDDAVPCREPQDRVIEDAMRHLPAMHEQDRTGAGTPYAEAQAHTVGSRQERHPCVP